MEEWIEGELRIRCQEAELVEAARVLTGAYQNPDADGRTMVSIGLVDEAKILLSERLKAVVHHPSNDIQSQNLQGLFHILKISISLNIYGFTKYQTCL